MDRYGDARHVDPSELLDRGSDVEPRADGLVSRGPGARRGAAGGVRRTRVPDARNDRVHAPVAERGHVARVRALGRSLVVVRLRAVALVLGRLRRLLGAVARGRAPGTGVLLALPGVLGTPRLLGVLAWLRWRLARPALPPVP